MLASVSEAVAAAALESVEGEASASFMAGLRVPFDGDGIDAERSRSMSCHRRECSTDGADRLTGRVLARPPLRSTLLAAGFA